jgi:S-adenosylmethionine synthetase
MIKNQNLVIREMLDQIQHETLRHGPIISQLDIKEKVKEQASRIQKIIRSKSDLPNIKLAKDEAFLYGFNCYAYALGLWEHDNLNKLIINYLAETGKNLISSCFMMRLILNKHLTRLDSPLLNSLIIYSNHEQHIKHAGLIKEIDPIIIESKWGEYPVMQHTLWDVPLSYGSNIAFYSLPLINKLETEIGNIILN